MRMDDGHCKIGLCGKFCQRCVYHSVMHNSCDYILIAGHPRGCPPGEGCTRREIGKRKKVAFANNPDVQELQTPVSRVPRIPEAEQLRRMELWKQGLSDEEMAKALGVTHGCISGWRRANGLAANPAKPKPRAPKNPRGPTLFPERMELYRQGLSDSEIAKRTGCTSHAIERWRATRNLPVNEKRAALDGSGCIILDPEEDARRMELYNRGMNDRRIAEAVGRTHGVIAKWRHQRGLPANATRRRPESSKAYLSADAEKQRRELYSQGLSDLQIAEATGSTQNAIQQWRTHRGLKCNRKRN